MIKGAVFDFGGVMTASSWPLELKAATDELGIGWESVILAGFSAHRLEYDRGTLTLSELYDRILGDAGIQLSPADRARVEAADTASWLARNEATLAWMRRLAARGLKIGILTNMPPGFAPLFRERYADFVSLADAVVVSGDEHLVKPMPEIYRLLERRIALKPEELCFVDDLEKNCAAARQCGWSAVRFEGVERTEAALDGLLGRAE